MILRRVSLLVAVVLVTAACGGGVPGVTPPTPTPTPTPSTGTVTGMVSVAATGTGAPSAAVPALPLRTRLDRPVYVPNQLMVKFRPGVAAAVATSLHAQAGGAVLRTIERLDVQVVRLGPGVAAAAAMAAYRASGLVEYVEQDAYAYRTVTPTDPMYGSQWHYPQIGLPAAWDITTGGPVIVAVLDTGIRFNHPDLIGVTVLGSGPVTDFVSDLDNGDGDGRDNDPTDPGCPGLPAIQSHGTHVAGTVAARTNNGEGVAGVNWGGVSATKIMPLRVLGGCGSGTFADIIDAIIYAAERGAKVINMSLGGSPGNYPTVDSAITYARNAGATLVAAAGNDYCGPVLYPAQNLNVIAVAATTNTNERARYSNCGPEIDVAAPGGGTASPPPATGPGVLSATWSPNLGNTYLSFQGTSMATPHVAGLVALMISRGITGPATIQSVLESTATDLGPAGKDTQFGSGLVNAAAAVSGGAATTQMRAFSGVISGSAITQQSNTAYVQPSGAFTITNAQTGTKSVFVWQDFNANNLVDTGDYYGVTPNVAITPGATTPIGAVTVQRYTGAPISVAAVPMAVAGTRYQGTDGSSDPRRRRG
ncbi:MAG: S8 family peptidase [bacterium]|nr:S8 family peptidase [bacterium]